MASLREFIWHGSLEISRYQHGFSPCACHGMAGQCQSNTMIPSGHPDLLLVLTEMSWSPLGFFPNPSIIDARFSKRSNGISAHEFSSPFTGILISRRGGFS